MTGRLSGAQAENIEGEENVKVKMKIQKKGWGGGGWMIDGGEQKRL